MYELLLFYHYATNHRDQIVTMNICPAPGYKRFMHVYCTLVIIIQLIFKEIPYELWMFLSSLIIQLILSYEKYYQSFIHNMLHSWISTERSTYIA